MLAVLDWHFAPNKNRICLRSAGPSEQKREGSNGHKNQPSTASSCRTVFLPRSAAQRYFTTSPQQRKHRPDSHSAYARNATPSAKISNIFRFRHDAVLVLIAGLSSRHALIHHSPTRQRGDIRFAVANGVKDRNLRSGFPIPVRCVCWRVLDKPDTYPTYGRRVAAAGSPPRFSKTGRGWSNRFLRLAATGWALRPGFSQSRQCPCRVCFVNKSGLGDKCRLKGGTWPCRSCRRPPHHRTVPASRRCAISHTQGKESPFPLPASPACGLCPFRGHLSLFRSCCNLCQVGVC